MKAQEAKKGDLLYSKQGHQTKRKVREEKKKKKGEKGKKGKER